MQGNSYLDSLLSVRRLRELIRRRRTAAIPEPLAERILHQGPLLVEREATEIGAILDRLVERAEREMEELGVEPLEQGGPVAGLSAAERRSVAEVAALLTWRAAADRTARQGDLGKSAIALACGWARAAGDDHQIVVTSSVAAMVLSDRFQVSAAAELVESVLPTAEATGDPELPLSLRLQLAGYHLERERLDNARELLEEIERLVREPSKSHLRERALNEVGLLRAELFEKCREHPRAIAALRGVIRRTDGDRTPDQRMVACFSLAHVLVQLSHDDEALPLLEEVVTRSRELGSIRITTDACVGMATIFLRLRQFDEASRMLDIAESTLPEEVGSSHVSILRTRGNLLINAGDPSAAEAILRRALDLVREGEPEVGINVYGLLGYAALQQGEPLRALSWLDAALARYPGHSYDLLQLRITRLRSLLGLGRFDEARQALDEIERETEAIPPLRIGVLRTRAQLCEREGDLVEALRSEREAAEAEHRLLTELNQQSYRNARVVAEAEALELEAEMERERSRRLEHELAGAMLRFDELASTLVEAEAALRSGEAARALEAITRGRQIPVALPAPTPTIEQAFVERLRELHPGITAKQAELAGLLRAGLTAAEVARHLELRPEGLKALRKRLRRTLGLAEGESLERAVALL